MDGQPEQCVNFRALIISKCQAQFVTNKSDIQMQKLEKDIVDCTESVSIYLLIYWDQLRNNNKNSS